jgi:very-short-patch-repair endonuclease
MENWQADFFYGSSPDTFKKAKVLRRNMTKPELLLWEKLRRKQLFGLRFRLQHPINNYIADFYCHSVKLVIEIDGAQHNEAEYKEYDIAREEMMQMLGITTLRFKNKQVIDEVESVISEIKEFIKKHRAE